MNQWEKFVELYKDKTIPSVNIMESLGISKTTFHRWGRDFGQEYGYYRTNSWTKEGAKFVKYVRKPKRTPKNYTKSYYQSKYKVYKTINGKTISYGAYDDEKTAQKVVKWLKTHNWNKESLKELKL